MAKTAKRRRTVLLPLSKKAKKAGIDNKGAAGLSEAQKRCMKKTMSKIYGW